VVRVLWVPLFFVSFLVFPCFEKDVFQGQEGLLLEPVSIDGRFEFLPLALPFVLAGNHRELRACLPAAPAPPSHLQAPRRRRLRGLEVARCVSEFIVQHTVLRAVTDSLSAFVGRRDETNALCQKDYDSLHTYVLDKLRALYTTSACLFVEGCTEMDAGEEMSLFGSRHGILSFANATSVIGVGGGGGRIVVAVQFPANATATSHDPVLLSSGGGGDRVGAAFRFRPLHWVEDVVVHGVSGRLFAKSANLCFFMTTGMPPRPPPLSSLPSQQKKPKGTKVCRLLISSPRVGVRVRIKVRVRARFRVRVKG
jgi:hypothetical protein